MRALRRGGDKEEPAPVDAAYHKYADRLLNDLDKLDWPEKVKKMQTDWIGNPTVRKWISR